MLDLEAWAGLSQVVREGDILGRDVSKRHVGRGRDGGGGGGGRGGRSAKSVQSSFCLFSWNTGHI